MSVISLITDFGLKDNFVGVIKAVVLSINPGAQIVDICHEIQPQDTLKAALMLRSSFRYFPCGSVHLVVVDPGVGSKRRKLIVKTKAHYFVAPDNGVLSLALKEEMPEEIVEITNDKYFLTPTSDTFHGRDIFAPVAAYLSKGEALGKFGKRIDSMQALNLPEVKITSKRLEGEIIYIDRFGNLTSNIDKDTFDNFISAPKSATRRGGLADLSGERGGNKKFKIYIKGKTIDKLSHSYSEAPNGKLVALINSFNYLELAANRNSASNYLKAEKGANIIVSK